MGDLISRQAAINALTSHIMPHNNEDGTVTIGVLSKSSIKNILNKLPSAQPEIIHCGDCRYKDDGIDEDGIPFLKCLHGRSYGGTRINDFCSWAERRTDEQDSE